MNLHVKKGIHAADVEEEDPSYGRKKRKTLEGKKSDRKHLHGLKKERKGGKQTYRRKLLPARA